MTLVAVHHQTRAVEALRGALRSGVIHHAYLFEGPEGVGKEIAAIGFAQALLCPERPNEGCGECNACLRIERTNHPDVTWLMPDEERVARGVASRSDFQGAPSRDIRVEQIRALQERLSFRPLEGRYKVAIIASAQQLNPQAQNALLKTLEEPPPQTAIVLLSSSMEKLLPTLRSRCSKLLFAPLPVAWIAERVQKERRVDAATAQLVATMSAGSLARALALDVEGLARRTEVIERFESLTRDDARTVLRFAEEFGASRDEAEDVLQILSWWIRDLCVCRAGGGVLANQDLEPRARERSAAYSDEALQRRRDLISLASEALLRNASPRLQLERVLVGMLREAGARP